VRICPFCSTENEAFFRFCLGCGADLDEALGSEDEASASPDTAASATAAGTPGVSPSAAVAGTPGVSPSAAGARSAPSGVGRSAKSLGDADSGPKTAVNPQSRVALAPELDVLPDVSGDMRPDASVQIPRPRTTSKDTAVDMPAVTPEMLAAMQGVGGKEARGGRSAGARQGTSASGGDSAAANATRAVEPGPNAAAGRAPAATPGSPPPRVARDRDKTLDPGGAVKPGSAASQAVAQAQGEVRRQAGPTEQVGAGPLATHASALPAGRSAADDYGEREEPVRTKPTPVSSLGGRSANAPQVAATPSALPRETRAQDPASPFAGRAQDQASPFAGRTPEPASPAARSAVSQAPPLVAVEGSTRRQGSPDVAPPSPKRAAGAKPKARLVIILEDGTDGSILDLSPDTTVVGREGVDISFPHDDFLAKRHAEFAFIDGALYLRPLESTNGVFLQVHQEVELDNGDVFRIGQQLLCFEMLSMVASSLAIDPKGQAIPLGSPVPEGAWGRLGQLIAPEALGSVYLLGGNEVYLGRERGDITFPGDGFVSGLHAQISMRNGRCFLKDLGSSNGTYLRLSKSTAVRRGMLVLAGQQLFRVES